MLKQMTMKWKEYTFTIEQATKTQRGSRGIAILFFSLGARWGWVFNASPQPFYPRETDPVPILHEVG